MAADGRAARSRAKSAAASLRKLNEVPLEQQSE